MSAKWQPYRESIGSVILRTGTIAVVIGVTVAVFSHGPVRWQVAALLAFWPSFGGHWVEVWFLNWLRPLLPAGRGVQIATRMLVWFISGAGFVIAMRLSLLALARTPPARWPAWWLGGAGFIGIELIAHLLLQLRGRSSFYDGLA